VYVLVAYINRDADAPLANLWSRHVDGGW
jgi:hypothetical protein